MRVYLKERRTETPDVISFTFDLRGQPFAYKPGQYVYYELDELAFPDERGKRRHFSLSSSPTEEGQVMFTTKMRGSGFKETLRHAPIGYELTMETPRGSFVVPEGDARRHVFIAGGIGITPYRSILRHAADSGAPVDAFLFYFNRSASDIAFRAELEQWAAQMPAFRLVHVLSGPEAGWSGEIGRLDEALLRKYLPDLAGSLFWISGPPPMVKTYMELLAQIGVPEDSLRRDSFTGY
ncbi:MAG: FAD-dependent oxidoreductase [Chloroflexi bacterium]|nr:FAD-dependent oxidoreductase [Chloroflexota bacterium]